jgi:hypothetical protein
MLRMTEYLDMAFYHRKLLSILAMANADRHPLLAQLKHPGDMLFGMLLKGAGPTTMHSHV